MLQNQVVHRIKHNHRKQSNIIMKNYKIKTQNFNNNEFKGITVKQYFRLCAQMNSQEPMQSIKQKQNVEIEEKKKSHQTPAFGLVEARQIKRKEIIKTENNQQNQFYPLKKKKNKGVSLRRDDHQKLLFVLQDQNNSSIEKKNDKNKSVKQKNKRFVTIPSKTKSNIFTNTSMRLFYYVKNKKQKMLDKIQAEKYRIKSMNINEIFLITKYASKFSINTIQAMK